MRVVNYESMARASPTDARASFGALAACGIAWRIFNRRGGEASTGDLFDEAAQACTRSFIESLAPGGYWKSDDDYWAPSPLRSGSDSTDSFHIFEHEGRYCFKDFAGDSGGDIIALVSQIRGGNAKEAAEWILRETGHAVPEARSSKGRKPKAAAVMPIPEEAKLSLNKVIESEYARENHGEAVTGWRYHLAEGGWAFAVVRYKKADGSKDITPYYWGNDGKWHEGKPQKDGLPLYRLPELLASPEKPVLVVEGEKCAEAARKALGEAWAVTTWSSGASSVSKTDWSPLAGRRVVVWPDADEPGYKAAAEIKKRLPQAEVLDVNNG